MDNPLPRMTYLEQARQFQMQIIGPIGKATMRSILEPLGFQYMKEYKKQEANGDWISVESYIENGDKFLLVFNETQLGQWRRQWKAHLQPGELSYKAVR